jgi:hypothetical protein
MATLLSLSSQTYTPQTLNLGPFSVASMRGQTILCLLQATSWPSTGLVITVSITYDTGQTGSATANGGTVPSANAKYPFMSESIPNNANTAALSIVVSQSLTSPILVTSQ